MGGNGCLQQSCLSWFLEHFDCSSVTIDLEINPSFETGLPGKSAVLPGLNKLIVRKPGSFNYLSFLSVSDVRHFSIPLPHRKAAAQWPAQDGVYQIPVDKITSLQLFLRIPFSGKGFSWKIFFEPFKEVVTLTLTYIRPSFFEKCYWPACWRKKLASGFLRRKSEMIFPKLVSLQVDMPGLFETYITPSEEFFSEIVREVELFLRARKRFGFPVRKLKLTRCPEFLYEKIAHLSREVDVFEFRRQTDTISGIVRIAKT